MADKIVKVASFPYTGEDGVERTALRGDKVDITDSADLKRGERLDVFATDADLKEGTVFGDFYAAQEVNRKAAADAGMPELAERQPEPDLEPVVVEPGRGDSREKWVAYARAKGAPDHETAAVDEGGLTRDRLREKYAA